MPERDSRVDTYIEKAAPFAKPILVKLRSLIFKACPDAREQAWSFFESFTPSQRWEYTEWVNEARTKETRDKRMATIVEWVSEGKTRLWKYKKV